MGRHHPNRETLSRFTEGELPPDEARGIERHLALCSDCRGRADELSTLAQLDSWLWPGYDEAFDRATERMTEQLAGFWGERRGSEDLLSELLRTPIASGRQRVRDEERFHSLKLCELLRAQSKEKWFSDPATGLDLAKLAVEVAQHLDSARYGSHLVTDAQALSWAYLGNGLRITADLWRAGKALRRAWCLHLSDDGDPYSKAELLCLTSSLLDVQDRIKEAIRLTDRAISLYCEVEDRHLEGAALIQKGNTSHLSGSLQEAILTFQGGLARIDPEKEPRLLLAGKNNLSGASLGWRSRAGLAAPQGEPATIPRVGRPALAGSARGSERDCGQGPWPACRSGECPARNPRSFSGEPPRSRCVLCFYGFG